MTSLRAHSVLLSILFNRLTVEAERIHTRRSGIIGACNGPVNQVERRRRHGESSNQQEGGGEPSVSSHYRTYAVFLYIVDTTRTVTNKLIRKERGYQLRIVDQNRPAIYGTYHAITTAMTSVARRSYDTRRSRGRPTLGQRMIAR